MYAIVILKEKYFNFTYASTRFEPYGKQTNYPIIVCTDWRTGFCAAKEMGYKKVLFCHSGTVFNDIQEFFKQLDNYPHKGLIGHIIDPLVEKEFFSLHPQCFFLEIDKFSEDCFDDGTFESHEIIRSSKNIHDNYTPLWISAGNNKIQSYQTKFGQKILARHLNNRLIVSNWHQKLRDNKVYLYRPEIYDKWILSQKNYIDLAEKQLWVTNNQLVTYNDTEHLVTPASGLFWIFSIATKSIGKITLCDISTNQIDLAKSLIDQWNGINYGEFVFNFVKNKKLKHIQFDKPLSKLEELQMQKKINFCQHVDTLFNKELANVGITASEFQHQWNTIKNIPIDIINDNIVNQINSKKIVLTDKSIIWVSNILDYKYTWIKSTVEEIELFNDNLKASGALVLQ
jgi:hypothetical protein